MLKIAIAQFNPLVGDICGNTERILDLATQAATAGADILLLPELALTGYPPEDWLLRDDFLAACEQHYQRLLSASQNITIIVGHPQRQQGKCFNRASVLAQGQVLARHDKHYLPNYGVFDELRYFSPGDSVCVFTHNTASAAIRIGILICEDGWYPETVARLRAAGAELILSLNASPFSIAKPQQRLNIMQQRVREQQVALIYANMVGGQDELVFDGASFALDREAQLCLQLPAYEEQLAYIDYSAGYFTAGLRCTVDHLETQVYQALVLATRDYVYKNAFPGVLLGLSGGIDSALTLAIAVDALGANRVQAIMMPSRYTAAISIEDARRMAQQLQVSYHEIPIDPLFTAFSNSLQQMFASYSEDTTEENLQARIRGVLLMALSNKSAALLLTTGNKSEIATGYATLYGDMAGGFAVLKDVSKTLVYQLARYRNQLSMVIPQRVIERAPSAELRANQCDQDTLPPYDDLDQLLSAYIEQQHSIGASPVEKKILSMLHRSEYKRRQAAIGPRISCCGFGRDWRYPITQGFIR